MHLVVVIPCLNEEKTIAQVIRKVPRDIQGVIKTDIVVVDDGSTDQSADLARSAGAKVVSHHAPMGVGAAFNSGLNHALELGADLLY